MPGLIYAFGKNKNCFYCYWRGQIMELKELGVPSQLWNSGMKTAEYRSISGIFTFFVWSFPLLDLSTMTDIFFLLSHECHNQNEGLMTRTTVCIWLHQTRAISVEISILREAGNQSMFLLNGKQCSHRGKTWSSEETLTFQKSGIPSQNRKWKSQLSEHLD